MKETRKLFDIMAENHISIAQLSKESNLHSHTIYIISKCQVKNLKLNTVQQLTIGLNALKLTKTPIIKPSDWLQKELFYDWIK